MTNKQVLISVITKPVCVILILAIFLGFFPTDGEYFLCNKASAEKVEFNPEYGSYTVSDGNILTAVPKENCGFRAWYYKGKEVSLQPTYKVPSGKNLSDYIPVFYSYNLLADGGFEKSAVGTNMKVSADGEDVWAGYTDALADGTGGDWTIATVTNEIARSGNNSLKLFGMYNTVYRTFSGLKTNAQYKLEFYYNLDFGTDENEPGYLNYVSVISGEDAVTTKANLFGRYLNCAYFEVEEGSCKNGEWKKVSLPFYTADNSDVKLCLLYKGKATNLFIDDMVLMDDSMAPPTYINEDFSGSSVQNWSVSNPHALKIYHNSGKLTTAEPWGNAASLQSAPMYLKKGCRYELSIDLDLSGVTQEYMQVFKDGKYQYDSNGDPVWEVYNSAGDYSANWINFSFSNIKDEFGSEKKGTFIVNSADDGGNVKCSVSDYSGSGKIWTTPHCPGTSYCGFGKSAAESRGLDPSNLNFKMSFTAPESGEAYLNIRLNGRGVYSIDNLKITESGLEVTDVAVNNAITTKGMSIRTVGKQGIRYKAKVDKRLLCAEGYFGARATEYGVVAIPKEFLNGKELLLDTEYTSLSGEKYLSRKGVAYSFAEGKDIRFSEDEYSIDYTGVLINIDENEWNDVYVIRSFIKYQTVDGGQKTLYSTPIESTVFQVAKKAYSSKNADGSFKESDDVRRYLYNDILGKYNEKTIKINNASPVISNNFQGIPTTIYHCYTFMNDAHGRHYTEEQAALEMERLKDSGITNVRTIFKNQFAWTPNGWDWQSDDMKAAYKWAKMLQERNITITLNPGWQFHDYMFYLDYYYLDEDGDGIIADTNEVPASSVPEVEYMKNLSMPDLYGETAGVDFSGMTIKEKYFTVASSRYAEWVRQALMAFKQQGINNIEYILPFAETGYDFKGKYGEEPTPTYSYGEWLTMVKALHDSLKKQGIRQDYKFIGPSQSIYFRENREVSFLEFYLNAVKGTEYENMIEILSTHQYTQPQLGDGYENSIYDPYACYDLAYDNYNYYKQILADNGAADAEFWSDEYFAYAPDAMWVKSVGMTMVQFAAGYTAAVNAGVDRLITWQLFDILWPNQINTGGEFIGGVHVTGTCPSFVNGDNCPKASCSCKEYNRYSSYTPRVTYYGINLIGKYMNYKNAVVYSTQVIKEEQSMSNGGLYTTAIESDGGKKVLLVVNTENKAVKFSACFETDVNGEIARYTYDPEGITPTDEALSIPSDGTICCNKGSFYDAIAPRSFAIYVLNQ